MTNSEWKALYDLNNDENIEIKSADKSAVVKMWVIEDYTIEYTRRLYKKFLTTLHPL